MFFVLGKKKIIIFFLIIFIGIVLFSSIFLASKNVSVPKSTYTIVIDAGHGGIDGGCVGKTTNIAESKLNLEYSLNLANQLKSMGFNCVLTRKDDAGLYDETAKNLKRSEMEKRKEIIESSNPDMVISIHMNSFPLRTSKGAKAFYKKGNEQGRLLAENIQAQLKSNMDYTNGSAKDGDYYILNCTNIPSVLIECGFLSNEEDEINLQNKDYQNRICYAVMSGIIGFLNSNTL